MTRILVATDLSARSVVALRRAGILARENRSELVVAHVIDEDLPPEAIKRRAEEAREILDDQIRTAACPPAKVIVKVGDTFEAIPSVARKLGASLIVAGDHRRSSLRDLFRDTTVERLIRMSALPVLVARTRADAGYGNPLVAVESEEAPELLKALEIVAPEPSRLTAVHAHAASAAGLMFYAGMDAEAISEDLRNFADRIRSGLERTFANAGYRVDIRVVDDVPLEAIRRISEAEHCDLIVVSTHARRASLRGLLGSVSSALIRDGDRDVLIVPR